MARNLKRIDLYCPEYNTDATIRIVEDHPNGQPHLTVEYEKGGYKGQKEIAAAIPPDWDDRDLAELIFLPVSQRGGTELEWPAWEVHAADHASATLFRFWKGREAARVSSPRHGPNFGPKSAITLNYGIASGGLTGRGKPRNARL